MFIFCSIAFGSVYVKVSQLQHVVSVKDALLQIYTHDADDVEPPSTYVFSFPVMEHIICIEACCCF